MSEAINEAEAEKAGLDPKAVQKVAGIAARLVRECEKLGIEIFGGSGGLSLRYNDEPSLDLGNLILWYKGGNVSGGCGAVHRDEEGLERGEGA